MQQKLTQTAVDSAHLVRGETEKIVHDIGKGAVQGLGLRIRAGGSRKWIFQYRFVGQQRRDVLGTAAALSLEAARIKARAMRVKLDDGIDPRIEKAERIESAKTIFADQLEDYLEVRGREMKPRSFAETKRHLQRHWKPLHKLPIAGITRATVAGRLREIRKNSGPVAADRARSSLSAFFAWLIGEGIGDANPVIGTNKASEDKERERALSDDELAAVWNGLPDNDYGRIVKLLILTLQRRDEIGSMRWSELDMREKVLHLPGVRTKNKRAHDVPLSDLAIELIECGGERDGRDLIFGSGEGGYSGWSHSKTALDDAVETDHWTLHDLRRTGRTGLGKLGVAPHVGEAVLNHLPAKLIRTYDKNKYEAEKRDALNRWAAHVDTVIRGQAAKVVALRSA